MFLRFDVEFRINSDGCILSSPLAFSRLPLAFTWLLDALDDSFVAPKLFALRS